MWLSLFLFVMSLICIAGGFGFMAAIFLILSLITFFNRGDDGFGGPDKSGYA